MSYLMKSIFVQYFLSIILLVIKTILRVRARTRECYYSALASTARGTFIHSPTLIKSEVDTRYISCYQISNFQVFTDDIAINIIFERIIPVSARLMICFDKNANEYNQSDFSCLFIYFE
jgi:hypothetical protein